jgi:transcription antitermination factor NusG
MQQWFVLQTVPGRERVALYWVRRRQYENWLPMCEVRRKCRWEGRFVEHASGPLFLGYLFVRFDRAERQWRELEELVCVLGVLCSNGEPVPVAESDMARLQRLAAADGGVIRIEAGKKRPLYAPGELLRVCDGAFADRIGPYVDENNGVVRLALDILGRVVPVPFAEAQVEPV